MAMLRMIAVAALAALATLAASGPRAAGLEVGIATAPERIDVQKFMANGTWIKPAWATRVVAAAISGGHGGGSGGTRGSGVPVYGGGGGAPCTMSTTEMLAADLPDTVPVIVGAGGVGGASQAGADANGVAGTNGAISQFGSYGRASVVASAAGPGGGVSAPTAASAPGERFSPGLIGSLLGGLPVLGTSGVGSDGPGLFCSGAGAGGSLTAANTFNAGGNSGFARLADPSSARSLRGTTEGAARNGFASGKGGDGARGEVWVFAWR